HELPTPLPDGRHFLYFRLSTDPEESGVFVGSVDDPPERQSKQRILATGLGASYVPATDGGSGWLLYMRQGALVAQPFDTEKFQLKGEPSPLAQGVGTVFETAFFSAAGNTLIYRTSAAARDFQLTWFDLEGKPGITAGEPGAIANARISPDGTH